MSLKTLLPSLVMLIFLCSCISLSDIENSHINSPPVENIKYPGEISIYLIYKNAGEVSYPHLCIESEQRELVTAWVNRYFSFKDESNVRVYIHLKSNVSLAQGLVNALFSTITYTLIPMYGSITYNIDVQYYDGKSLKFKSASLVNEGMFSALFLPAMPFVKSLQMVRRNNVENTFYRASLEQPKSEGNASKFLDLKPTVECGKTLAARFGFPRLTSLSF